MKHLDAMENITNVYNNSTKDSKSTGVTLLARSLVEYKIGKSLLAIVAKYTIAIRDISFVVLNIVEMSTNVIALCISVRVDD